MNDTLVTAAHFRQGNEFNPWAVPDTFTVYSFAPDYVKPLLHPHWQTQKAVHPLWAYIFGLYYFVLGRVLYYCMQKYLYYLVTSKC